MHHKLVVAAILSDDKGKILVTKRPAHAKIAPDKFHFPGGHVEEGEDLKTALARELREELGIETVIGKPVHVGWYESGESLSIVIFFEGVLHDGSPAATVANGELETLEWIDPREAHLYLQREDFNYTAVSRWLEARA